MRYQGSHNFAPVSLSAPTLSALEVKIRQIQRDDGSEYRFISFYFDPLKERHVAWYYKLNKNDQEIKELIDGITKE